METMVLHGEQYWLMLYVALLIAGIIAAIVTGLAVWQVILVAVVGIPVVFFGWLLQVGRFG